jgi:hypothetical protein
VHTGPPTTIPSDSFTVSIGLKCQAKISPPPRSSLPLNLAEQRRQGLEVADMCLEPTRKVMAPCTRGEPPGGGVDSHRWVVWVSVVT